MTTQYNEDAVRIAREIARLRTETDDLSRAAQGEFRSVELDLASGTNYYRGGELVGTVGETPDGDLVIVRNPAVAPTPPVPEPPVATGQIGGVSVVWTGGFVDAVWTEGISHVEIHATPGQTDELTDATQIGTLTSSMGGAFFYSVPQAAGTLYYRLQTVSVAGLHSASSGPSAAAAIDAVDPAEMAAHTAELENLNTVVLPGLQSDLDVNTAELLDLNTNVLPGIQGQINTHTDEITTVVGNVASHETRLDTAEGSISSHDSRITTAEGEISTVESRVTTAEGNISSVDTRITTAEGTLTTHTSQIGTLGATIDTHESRLDGAESNISSVTTIVNGKNKTTYSTTGGPGTTPNTAGDTWRHISGSEVIGSWKGNGGTSWTAEKFGGAVLDHLDAATITVGTLAAARIASSSITADKIATNAVTAAKIEAGAVTASKLNVTMGGENLLANSTFASTTAFEGWSLAQNPPNRTITRFASGGLANSAFARLVRLDGATGGGPTVMTSSTVTGLSAGTVVTASAWIRHNTANQGGVAIDINGTQTGARVYSQPSVVGTWQRVKTQFTLTGTTAYVRLFQDTAVATDASGVDVAMVQLEIGDIATAWSPRTEELLPGTIVANHIAANAVTADKIQANAVTAAKIAARNVNAYHLVISNFDNLIQDPNFLAPLGQGWTSFASIAVNGNQDGTKNAGVLTPNAATIWPVAKPEWEMTTENGASYRTRVKVHSDLALPAAAVTIRVRFFATDGTTVDHSGGVTSAIAAGEWGVAEGMVTTPSDKTYNRMGFFLSVAAHPTQTLKIAEPSMTRAADGKLIVDGAITAIKIAANTITANEIATGAITADEIAAGAVTATKILANTITANEIATGAITADEVAANAITAAKIAANAVVAGKIDAGAVTTTTLAADAVTADKLDADAITAKHTLTGPTIRTAVSGERLEISTTELSAIRFYSGAVQELEPGRITADVVDEPFPGTPSWTQRRSSVVIRSPQINTGTLTAAIELSSVQVIDPFQVEVQPQVNITGTLNASGLSVGTGQVSASGIYATGSGGTTQIPGTGFRYTNTTVGDNQTPLMPMNFLGRAYGQLTPIGNAPKDGVRRQCHNSSNLTLSATGAASKKAFVQVDVKGLYGGAGAAYWHLLVSVDNGATWIPVQEGFRAYNYGFNQWDVGCVLSGWVPTMKIRSTDPSMQSNTIKIRVEVSNDATSGGDLVIGLANYSVSWFG